MKRLDSLDILLSTKPELYENSEKRLKKQNLNETIVSNTKIPYFPNEIWSHIFSFLSKTDIRIVMEVCFSFYLLCYKNELLKKATSQPGSDYEKIIASKGINLVNVIAEYLNLEHDEKNISLSSVSILQDGSVFLNIYRKEVYLNSIIATWKGQNFAIKPLTTSQEITKLMQLKNGTLIIRNTENQVMILDPITMEFVLKALSFDICNFIQMKSGNIYVLDKEKNLYQVNFALDVVNKIASFKEQDENDITNVNMETKLMEFNKNTILIFFSKDPKHKKNRITDIYSYNLDTNSINKFDDKILNNTTPNSSFFLQNKFFVKNNFLHILDPKDQMHVFSLTQNEFIEVTKCLNIGKSLADQGFSDGSKTIPLSDDKYMSIVFKSPTYYLAVWNLNAENKIQIDCLTQIPKIESKSVSFARLRLRIKENGNVVLYLQKDISGNSSTKYFQEIVFYRSNLSLVRYLSSEDQKNPETVKLIEDLNSQSTEVKHKIQQLASTSFWSQQDNSKLELNIRHNFLNESKEYIFSKPQT